jgi:hypothetical protein
MSGQRNRSVPTVPPLKRGGTLRYGLLPVTTATQALRYGTALQSKETWESIGSVALRVIEMGSVRHQKPMKAPRQLWRHSLATSDIG